MSELRELQERVHAAKDRRITLVEQQRQASAALISATEDLETIGLTPSTAADIIEEGTQELTELLGKLEKSLSGR